MFHLQSHVFGQLHEALVGDGGQNAGRLWRDIRVVLNAEEVCSPTFIDVFFLFGIKIKLTGVPFFVGDAVCVERCGIVAAHLILTRSQRSRAVVAAHNDVWVARKSTFKIRSHRGDKDDECVFARRTHAHLRRSADEQRTNVKRSSALVGWYVRLVEPHHHLNHLFKTLGRQLRHHDTAASTLQTSCVLVHSKHAYLPIRTAISLQTLESFLSIVQAGGGHVHVEVLVGADFNLAPLTVTIVATHVIVGLHVTEGQVSPINIFHHLICLKGL